MDDYLIHDAIALDACRLILVGEVLAPNKAGAIVISNDAGESLQLVRTFPHALQLRKLARSKEGVVWIAGNGDQGEGIVLRFDPRDNTVLGVSLPTEVVALSGIAISGDQVVVTGSTNDSAVILASSERGSAPVFKMRARIPEDNGRLPVLNAVAVAGPLVAAVGTDGVRAIVTLSRDAARTFNALPSPRFLKEVLSVAFRGDALDVGGYQEPMPKQEVATAATTRLGATRWDLIPLPKGIRAFELSVLEAHEYMLLGGASWPLFERSHEGAWSPVTGLTGGDITNMFAAQDGISYAVSPSAGLFRGHL